MKPNKIKGEKWEERFKNWRIVNTKEEGSDAVGAWESYYVDDIIDFISTLLEEQKKEIGETGIMYKASYALINRGDGNRCAWCNKLESEIKDYKDHAAAHDYFHNK